MLAQLNAWLSIIAIGGGGFTHGVDPDLDSFVLGKCQTPRPRIGFVATASDDDPVRVERFYTRFADEPCTPTHMRSDWPADEIRRWIAAQDLIYVGGGNTSTLLGSWARWGLPPLFREVSSRGTLLAGVSAGAVCWFEAALSDSVGPTLGPSKGLGFIGGSCCPHYSEDPERRPAPAPAPISSATPVPVWSQLS